MIKKEFSNIFHSKSIMLLIVAIVLIPFVYSFCFLTSAWDPYGNTGKVPIAVVNHDKPTHLQGKLVNVGAQTVAKLRKDNQLGWHIVSAKEAAKGLKDNKYYTVVTIPENFSKNAATVLNLHPKQMKLTYKTNGSLNYISEVMSQVGADKLNAQIRANVTNAFASTLFDQVGGIGKKIGTAANGATQISDGTVTLDNGVNQYTVGVSKVHNGIQTMKVAASPLSSGVKQLTDGGNQLKDGTTQLVDGAGKLNDGLGTLKGSVPALSSGVKQLDDGGYQIKNGIAQIDSQINGTGDSDLRGGVSQLAAGSKQLTDGLKTFNGQTPTLTKGAQDLYTALHTLKTSAVDDQQLEAKVVKLNKTVNSAVSSLKMAYNLAGGTFDFTSMIPGMIDLPSDFKWTDRDKAKATSDKETAAIADMKSTIDSLDDTIAKTKDDATKTALTATKKELETKLTKIQSTSKATITSLNNSESLLDVVYWQMTDTGTDGVGDPTGLQAAVNKLEAGLTTKQKDPTGQNKDGVDFAEALTALDAGAKELNDGVNKATGNNPKLVAGE